MRTPFSVGAEPADTMSADTNDKADATTAMTNLRRAKRLWYAVVARRVLRCMACDG